MRQLWFLICVSLLFLLGLHISFWLTTYLGQNSFYIKMSSESNPIYLHILLWMTKNLCQISILFIMQIWNVVSYSNTSPLFYPMKITLAKSVHKCKQGSKLPSVICDVSVRWCAMLLCYWEENKKIFVVVVCSSSSNGANLPVARVRLF